MTSRQDKTRSPAPNSFGNLYLRESELEQEIMTHEICIEEAQKELAEVRAAIKRACGDAVVPIRDLTAAKPARGR